MYKQCQTEPSARRQRELEQGLLGVMGKRHYEEISVSDLCSELNVPRKTFYRYFSGKDGALHSLIDHALMDFDLYGSSKKSEEWKTPLDYMTEVFRYWMGRRELLDALEKSNLSGILVQRAMVYTNDMDIIWRFLQIKDRQMREYATLFMITGLMSQIIRWHHDGFIRSPEEMAQLAMQLLTEPLYSGKLEDI